MSTWMKPDQRTWLHKLCENVLRQGPVPEHVGIILDGNRRYAKENNLPRIEGHRKGFDKITETLRWCLNFGIAELTGYVFSIENFKRSKEEVDDLMLLLKTLFEKLLEDIEQINKDGICIQIIGDWSLVPHDLKQLMAKAMLMTKNNTKVKLNVAFAYTGRNEMARGVNSLIAGVTKGELQLQDLSEDLLEDTFQLYPPKPLDLLIRTSGESRLSDFLLWQSSEIMLHFIDVLWPDFTGFQFLAAVLQYQTNHLLLSKIKPGNIPDTPCAEIAKRKQEFSEKIRNEKWTALTIDSESSKML